MKNILLFALLAGMAGCTSAPMTLQSGPDAEITADGLVRVNNTRGDAAWLRPGMDLSGYDRLMLRSAGIRYRSVREANRLRLSNADEFPLDDRQKEARAAAEVCR